MNINYTAEDGLGESDKWEMKVLFALSRLQKEKGFTDSCGKPIGIDNKQIVEYVSSHICNLDGDIESQVITALVTSIKKGIICVLKNGKYHVVGPQSKPAVSNCITRVRHGPNCGCLRMINYLSKTCPSTCCYIKSKYPKRKKCRKPLFSDTSIQKIKHSRKPCERRYSSENKRLSMSLSPTPTSSSSLSPSPSSCNKCPKSTISADSSVTRKESQKKQNCWACNASGDNFCEPGEKFLSLEGNT